MTISINRRGFLLSLIALGEGYALSEKATAQEVTQAWEKALANPWYFAVNDYGTIVEPDYPQNETWGDIFDIEASYLDTPAEIVGEIERCQLLVSHMQDLASDELDSLRYELESEEPRSAARTLHLKRLVKALESDSYDGWRQWIEIEGPNGVERFQDMISSWAHEPADYLQSEWFPINWGAQGRAKQFFESLDFDVLDALGVVIVEGEHPGSSYYAAELRHDLEDANSAAANLELPFRFRRGDA